MEGHEPYSLRFNHPPDFMVEYEILTEAQGGRKTPVYQGIRWDLWYDDEEHQNNHLFKIWPEFLQDDDEVVKHREVPVDTRGKAVLWIINKKMRRYHQQRIMLGMNCYAREGPRTVANYRVVKILGLMTNPVTENIKD